MKPEMTCERVQSFLAESFASRSEPQIAGTAEHVAQCANCRGVAAAYSELAEGLALTRDSAGEVPVGLDQAMLAEFRCHMAERRKPSMVAIRKIRPAPVWGFGLAAAVAVIATGLLVVAKKPARTGEAPLPLAPALVNASVKSPAGAGSPVPSELVAIRPRRELVARAAKSSTQARLGPSAIPEEFHSLMYCDELSCAGPMEVIRVQVPSSTMMQAAGSPGGGFVNAEVIVGSDGIARGIRLGD